MAWSLELKWGGRKLVVSPIGFTKNLHQWMALSSIVIAVIEGKAIQSKFLDVVICEGS
jgi:hypothetical protein